MFSYYGSKSKIVDKYPKPQSDTIIEPFAGSARYALRYWDREVLLVDKYEVVVRIWKWLQQCSPGDLSKLPRLRKGMQLSELNISEEERLFLGMMAGIASTAPRNKVSSFAGIQFGEDRRNKFDVIAANLYKIKHWKIVHGCYTDIPNQAATWYIDPPYEAKGHAYVENKIDFQQLSLWCQSRLGQVIVCENAGASWLPFSPLVQYRAASLKPSVEAIWTNSPVPATLF